ncbi:hypothetical protein BC938DRAFT_479119 [Jimgerdemannia flammicorona]|uniref:Uncharacterized protein n=1 Tax=Jimgerdemannia flammicorona TaxID=994334 RepID=A0A433QLJ3_9FUNG|nr:hypothetical protein BC938DRAFT_479119 [Jimgerdemannia flammicorona]
MNVLSKQNLRGFANKYPVMSSPPSSPLAAASSAASLAASSFQSEDDEIVCVDPGRRIHKSILEYFNTTPPEEWSFVGFYKLREQQADFNKVFSLEAFNLRKTLGHLLEEGTAKEKEYATKLFSALKVIVVKILDCVKNGWGTH